MVTRGPGRPYKKSKRKARPEPEVTLAAVTQSLLKPWFDAPAEVSADCTYADPKAAAARACFEATVKQTEPGVILVRCDDPTAAKACMINLDAWFRDVPDLIPLKASHGADEIRLRSKRTIVVTSAPRAPENLLVALRLTGGAEPVAAQEMTPTEWWSHISHIFCVELYRNEPALTPDCHKLLKSLCPETSDDPTEARQELVVAFERMR